MDAVKFLEEANRMCNSCACCSDNGKKCPIYDFRNGTCIGTIASITETDEFSEIVSTVEKWSKKHSGKTRQSEFIERWPNVKVFVDGVLDFCPQELDSRYPCQSTDIEMRCQSCRRKFWMQEVE